MFAVLFREAPAIPWRGIAWMLALFFGEAPTIPRAETAIIIRIIVVPLKRGRFWRVLIGVRRLLGRFLGGLRGSGFLSAELFRQRLVELLKIFDDRCWRVRCGKAIGKSLAAKQSRNREYNKPTLGHRSRTTKLLLGRILYKQEMPANRCTQCEQPLVDIDHYGER